MACAGTIPPELRIRQLLANRYLSNKWFQRKLDKEMQSDCYSGPHIKAAATSIREIGLERFVGKVEEKFKFLLRDTEAEVVLKGETFQWRPCLRIYTDGSKSKKGCWLWSGGV